MYCPAFQGSTLKACWAIVVAGRSGVTSPVQCRLLIGEAVVLKCFSIPNEVPPIPIEDAPIRNHRFH